MCGGRGLSLYDEAEDQLQWLCGARFVPAYPLHLAGGAYGMGRTGLIVQEAKQGHIRDLTREEALRTFNGLNPVAFTYKAAGGQLSYWVVSGGCLPELVATKNQKGLSAIGHRGGLNEGSSGAAESGAGVEGREHEGVKGKEQVSGE